MEHNYNFPVKAIVMILVTEAQSFIDAACKESVSFRMYDETRAMASAHMRMVESLSTYEEIEDYLSYYRRMSLQEWIDSL